MQFLKVSGFIWWIAEPKKHLTNFQNIQLWLPNAKTLNYVKRKWLKYPSFTPLCELCNCTYVNEMSVMEFYNFLSVKSITTGCNKKNAPLIAKFTPVLTILTAIFEILTVIVFFHHTPISLLLPYSVKNFKNMLGKMV